MAHELSFSDGTTTVAFTAANGYQVERYPLSGPDVRTDFADTAWMDGSVMMRGDLANVSETIELLTIGASVADLQAKIRTLEGLFLRARDRQRWGAGAKLTASLRLDGEASAWETEVLFGRVTFSEDALNLWPNRKTPVRLHFTRRYYWEGAVTILANAVSLNNGSGNVVTLGTVAGVLPAPLTLKITNTSGSSLWARNFYISNDAFNGFTGTQHRLAGGSASWTESGEFDVRRVTSTIADSVIAKCNGERFHLLGLFTAVSSDIVFKATLYSYWDPFYFQIADGPEVYNGDERELVDLGVFQLPPAEDIAETELRFGISEYVADGGAGSFTLGALQLMPARDYLHIRQRSMYYVNNASVVWDGAASRGYVEAVGGAKWPLVNHLGGGIMVHPGRTNKINVTFDEDGGYQSARTMTLTATYRPRRLTL